MAAKECLQIVSIQFGASKSDTLITLMSDPVTGWLTLAKAPKDATYGSNTKWDLLTRANDVRTLNTNVNLPDFFFNNFGGIYLPFTRFAQYNYIAPQAFTIIGLKSNFYSSTVQPPFNGIFVGPDGGLFGMMVRYRVGNVVTRYQLVPGVTDLPFWPFYSGQLISPQFCLEFYGWQQSDSYTLNGGYQLITSLLTVPITYNQSPSIIQPTGGLITNFQIPLGQPLPYIFPTTGPWNSN